MPYKELCYYHGDDGKYVLDFPPIRYTLTKVQAQAVTNMEEMYRQYDQIKKALAKDNNIFCLQDDKKEEILSTIKQGCITALEHHMFTLESEFNNTNSNSIRI